MHINSDASRHTGPAMTKRWGIRIVTSCNTGHTSKGWNIWLAVSDMVKVAYALEVPMVDNPKGSKDVRCTSGSLRSLDGMLGFTVNIPAVSCYMLLALGAAGKGIVNVDSPSARDCVTAIKLV